MTTENLDIVLGNALNTTTPKAAFKALQAVFGVLAGSEPDRVNRRLWLAGITALGRVMRTGTKKEAIQ